MTPHQTAVNHRVVTAEAERLEAAGYQGNAHQFVEQLLLRAISEGYRPLEKPPPPRPVNLATDEQRRQHLTTIRAELAAVKRKQQEVGR